MITLDALIYRRGKKFLKPSWDYVNWELRYWMKSELYDPKTMCFYGKKENSAELRRNHEQTGRDRKEGGYDQAKRTARNFRKNNNE